MEKNLIDEREWVSDWPRENELRRFPKISAYFGNAEFSAKIEFLSCLQIFLVSYQQKRHTIYQQMEKKLCFCGTSVWHQVGDLSDLSKGDVTVTQPSNWAATCR